MAVHSVQGSPWCFCCKMFNSNLLAPLKGAESPRDGWEVMLCKREQPPCPEMQGPFPQAFGKEGMGGPDFPPVCF